jgi:RNA polymerase sigma factor (TIGR02999 family)
MTAPSSGQVTRLLGEIQAGSAGAKDRLVGLIYEELRRMAAGLVGHRAGGGSLPPTALVHEAFLRLEAGDVLAQAPNRRYLFAAAAQAMRRVLVDHARQRRAAKRGEGLRRVPLDDVLDYFDRQQLDVLALDEALDELSAQDERQWLVIVLRFFGGFSVEEVAQALEVSVSAVEGDFRLARAWLRRKLAGGEP